MGRYCFLYAICEKTDAEKLINLPKATRLIRIREEIQTQVF